MLVGMILCLFAMDVDAQVYVRINSPAEIAGTYAAVAAAFGPVITTEVAYDLSRPSDTLALAVPVEDLSNTAALVNRGSVGFWNKALNVQTALASAMIAANHALNAPFDSNAILIMGAGANDPAAITIPCAMVSFNTFLAWQPYIASGINASLVPAAPGDYSTNAITVVDGINMGAGPVAPSATQAGAHASRWFQYVAAADGSVIVSSCGGAVDTRLWVHENAVGNVIKFNDDCDAANFDYGSGTAFNVVAGNTYYIEWDDSWSSDDFMFVFMTGPVAGPSDNCAMATDVTPGPQTADAFVYPSATDPEVTLARWYKFTPAGPGTITVSSCGGGSDTRLFVYSGACGALSWVAENDDDCEVSAGGDPYASRVTDLVVEAGITYYFEWDSRWSADAFGWDLSFVPLTTPVAITLQVDMNNQTVGANGVHVAGDFQDEAGFPSDWDPATTAMDDTDGDGIYSYTFVTIPGFSFQYKFVNGNAWGSDESVPAECGNNNGGGAYNREFTAGISDATVPAVCYGACSLCPQFDCNPAAIICDGLDNYTLGALGPQATWWSTWSGTEGGPEDGIVSNDMASSGPNSMKIEGTGAQDVLLVLGDNTTGSYELRWKMNIPATHTGYFNLQGSPTTGTVFNYEVYFDDADTGRVVQGNPNVLLSSFTYTHDVWMDVVQRYDLDNNYYQIWIDGQMVYTSTADINLASIDFFAAGATNLYYIDEVQFIALGAQDCNPAAIICDGLEFYPAGSAPGGQSPWWTTWTNDPGGVDDGLISTEQALTGNNSMLISEIGLDDVILKLGDRTSGHYQLHWSYYVPTGFGAYYNVQKVEALPGSQFGVQMTFNIDGTITGDLGAAGNITGSYPHDQWFEISHDYDLDNDALIVTVNGVEVGSGLASAQANLATGTKQLGGVDFYGNAGNRFFVDNIELIALDPIVIVVNHDVTLEVDMDYLVNNEGGTVSPNGVHLAGDLQSEAGFPGDWDPATTLCTQVAGTNKWRVTLSLPDGNYEYKFVNSNAWDGNDESVSGDCAVAGGNRKITVAGANMSESYCYRYCVNCPQVVGNEDVKFEQGISIAPNPTKTATNVTFNFDVASDLTLHVYNSIGQKISTRSLGYLKSGIATVDVNNLPDGLYFIEMTNGAQRAAKRLIVQK